MEEKDTYIIYLDLGNKLWKVWYGWGRSYRSKRLLKILGKLIIERWEEMYEVDPSNKQFTLTYYASKRQLYTMKETDISLNFRTHGFNDGKQMKKVQNYVERLIFMLYGLENYEAENGKLTPEIEDQFLWRIVQAMPKKKRKHFVFDLEKRPYNRVDIDMIPHSYNKVVAKRTK